MNDKLCCIVGAGEFDGSGFAPHRFERMIAVDGGYAALKKISVEPDEVIGDFDSLGYVPDHPKTFCHPAMKDDTDMMLAVKAGLSDGYRRFVIYGGTGGRIDHTLANIQTLSFIADSGGIGFLSGSGFTVTAIKNGSLSFDCRYEGIVSVFCLSGRAEGVCLDGLKYKLENAVLTGSVPVGVSNEFTGKPSAVSVQNGTLAVLWYGNDTLALPQPVQP